MSRRTGVLVFITISLVALSLSFGRTSYAQSFLLPPAGYEVSGEMVRVTFELSSLPSYRVLPVKVPPKVIIDFEDTSILMEQEIPVNDVLVQSVRISMDSSSRARVVISLNYLAGDSRVYTLQDPPRVVVELPKVFENRSSIFVTRGVEYLQIRRGIPQGPLMIDALYVDMKDPDIEVRTALAGSTDDGNPAGWRFGLEATSTLVERSGAIAGMNGAYFAWTGKPLGLVIIDGRVMSMPIMNRSAFGITWDNRIIIDNVDERKLIGWQVQNVRYALGAGPRLVKDGQVYVTSQSEGFKPDVAVGRAPRSALGVTGDGRLILVTVGGRRSGLSIGVTLEELAQIMIELGARDALNLDGGGSSTLVVRGYVVNLPSGEGERKVGSAVLVFARESSPGSQLQAYSAKLTP